MVQQQDGGHVAFDLSTDCFCYFMAYPWQRHMFDDEFQYLSDLIFEQFLFFAPAYIFLYPYKMGEFFVFIKYGGYGKFVPESGTVLSIITQRYLAWFSLLDGRSHDFDFFFIFVPNF